MARKLLNQINLIVVEVMIVVILHATHLSSYNHESKTLCVYAGMIIAASGHPYITCTYHYRLLQEYMKGRSLYRIYNGDIEA